MNININIDNLTEDELLALNRRVIARLKLIQQHNTLNSMIKFEVGQRVSFDPDGRMRTGVLIKFNPKTVVVLTDDGQRWKVSPQLIRHLIDSANSSTSSSVSSSKVTTLRRVEQGSP
jgi:hypothetical protein